MNGPQFRIFSEDGIRTKVIDISTGEDVTTLFRSVTLKADPNQITATCVLSERAVTFDFSVEDFDQHLDAAVVDPGQGPPLMMVSRKRGPFGPEAIERIRRGVVDAIAHNKPMVVEDLDVCQLLDGQWRRIQ